MSWAPSLHDEIASMFDGYSWHRDEIELAYAKRRDELRAQSREWSQAYRDKMRLSATWRQQRRDYARSYMGEYDRDRRADDAEYRERKRKAAREAMRRNYARKKGQIVPFLKRGGKPTGIPHRPHRCTVCKQPGHHRQSCALRAA